ncbi:MAG: 4-hydroxy-3-methylbut-2-enyl diphosphate reductase [Flavobacteriales bacterium]|nr:MAG: 4-hydroxy-3-methylbut-2-enyl diphosphate reductase [Flavobacteriales bacterium]
MKQFDVPPFYRSSLIGEIKKKRKLDDPRKKDFKPTQIKVDNLTFLIARHFGFCYGVENAIEKSYKAIKENPDKRIFLLSQMIHNPDVNEDLESHGLKFLQDTHGKQLIPFEELTSEDIVIIPAFGTTVEIEKKLVKKGIEIDTYNTTCPFVEKVWNRSAKLGSTNHTIIIHGKVKHEETRATFSHSSQNSPSLVIKDIAEAQVLAEFILGERELKDFPNTFRGNYSENFDPDIHLNKIGVVNQTTMLATETQEITDYLRSVMTQKFGLKNIKEHMADTRDTLCYATNDNQSATIGLLEESIDLAVVVGGYNSSNTTHLVELLEQKFNTYFIRNESEIIDENQIYSFDIHTKKRILNHNFLPDKKELRIAITSGASCPDKLVDEVIHKIIKLKNLNSKSIQIKL